MVSGPQLEAGHRRHSAGNMLGSFPNRMARLIFENWRIVKAHHRQALIVRADDSHRCAVPCGSGDGPGMSHSGSQRQKVRRIWPSSGWAESLARKRGYVTNTKATCVRNLRRI